jgi:hypothetical protein
MLRYYVAKRIALGYSLRYGLKNMEYLEKRLLVGGKVPFRRRCDWDATRSSL